MPDSSNHGQALPLKGVVVCSTSLDQNVRTLLAELSDSMGAIHRLDLTTDVTHLIVGHVDTPKYKHVAKERPDIHILKPDWIQAMRDAWTSGEDFDVADLVHAYRLPALYNLRICVTGFDDLEQRQTLMRTIADQGATYSGDLTKSVTHLIAKTPEGPKYDRAKQWGLKIVSLKWLEESVQRGMVLEEGLYDPLRPETMQGQGAFIRDHQDPPPPYKRNREDAGTSFSEENGKRKLRRTVSSRLNNHSQNMWAEMSAVDEAVPVKEEDEWNETRLPVDETILGPPEESLTSVTARNLSGADVSRPGSRAAISQTEPRRGLFSNCLFQATGHPERRTRKIHEILQNEGGQIADFPDDLYSAIKTQSHNVTVLIVPSEWNASTKEPLPDVPGDTWLVTEWWIERCIVSKSLINPDQDFYSQPRLNLSKDCFKGMIIGTSGLGNDAKLVKSIVTSAGGRYEEHFKPTCSTLVIRSPDAKKEKVGYAMKHNVPVVSERWLQSSVSSGEGLPIKPYQMPSMDTVTQVRGDSRPPEPLKKNDDSSAQRLSVTRKRSVIPSLKLIKSHPVQPLIKPSSAPTEDTAKKPRAALPFVEEDDSSLEDDPPLLAGAQFDGSRSQPLTYIPSRKINLSENRLQEVTNKCTTQPSAPDDLEQSAERLGLARAGISTSQTTHAESYLPPDENAAPAAVDDDNDDCDDAALLQEKVPAHNNIRLNEDIKSLLDRSKDAPASVNMSIQGKNKKSRRLGRAPSNISNPSAPASLMRSKSTDMTESTAASASPLDLGIPMPSQQLGYETVDAKEHRARMSKRVGTDFTDEGIGKRVESIGVVKDIDTEGGETGVGGRLRGRHRNVKA